MVIWNKKKGNNEFINDCVLKEAKECFYCLEQLKPEDNFLFWGSGYSLFLHVPCFYKLFIRLARDVHEIELAEKQDSIEVKKIYERV